MHFSALAFVHPSDRSCQGHSLKNGLSSPLLFDSGVDLAPILINPSWTDFRHDSPESWVKISIQSHVEITINADLDLTWPYTSKCTTWLESNNGTSKMYFRFAGLRLHKILETNINADLDVTLPYTSKGDHRSLRSIRAFPCPPFGKPGIHSPQVGPRPFKFEQKTTWANYWS